MTDAPLPHPPPPRATGGRLDGIDLARGLAIIGMVSVHVAPSLAGDGGWYAAPYGRASTLFALVAGLGITLGSRRGTTAANVSRLLWRAAWLAPVGLLLGMLGTPVAIILQYYALWFVLAAPLLRLSTRALTWITAVGVVVGPTVLVWSRVARPDWYASGRGVWLGEFGDVLLTGYYPTVSWIWLVVLGMALARLDLAARRVQTMLLLVGGSVSVLGYTMGELLSRTLVLGDWERLVDTMGHADGPVEQIAVGGLAVAVVGACLLVASIARPVVAPGVALGRFALTVYVGHIVVYAVARESMLSRTAAEGAQTTVVVAVVGALTAMAWLTVFRRGPLEALDRAGHQHVVLPALRGLGVPVGAASPLTAGPPDGSTPPVSPPMPPPPTTVGRR